ncbi:MAG: hypothetical protein AAGE84_07355 [Cyanobacteria bacterium P01_G01_bin.39]
MPKSWKGLVGDSVKNIFEGAAGAYIGNKLSEDDKDDEEDSNKQISGYLSEEAEDDFDTDGNPYATLESLEDLLNDGLDEYGDDASNLCDHHDDVDE